MQKKSEFGRSMLETVMVMAIVCIISITGIYIHLQAMNGVRADGIVKDVLVRMAQEKSNKDLTKSSLGKRVYVPTYTKTTGQSESEKNTTKGRYGYSFEIIGNYSENALLEVEVRDGILTQSVCESLKKVLNNYQEKTFDEVLIGEVNILEENCPPEINSIRFRIGHPEKAKKVVMPTDISLIPTVVKTPDDCSLYPNSSTTVREGQQIGSTGCYCTGNYFVSGNACVAISCADYTGTSTTGTGGVAGKANDRTTDCKCPLGKIWGTNSCVCPSNQYLNGSTCTTCPLNATCNDGENFTCNPGYEVEGNTCKAVVCTSTITTSIENCKTQTACTSPSGTFYTCTECETGYYKSGNRCVKCPDHTATCDTDGFTCEAGYEVEGNTCKAVVCASTITASIENCQTQTTCTNPSGTFYTCTECETGYYKSGNRCVKCPDHTATCDTDGFTCAAGYYKNGEECGVCNGDREYSSAGATACLTCDVGTKPNSDHSACVNCNSDGSETCGCTNGEKWYYGQCKKLSCTSWTTNECGEGYYCRFDPYSTNCYQPGVGTCTQITGGNRIGDGTYLHSTTSGMNWWTAYSWCKGNGMNLVTEPINGHSLTVERTQFNGGGPIYAFLGANVISWTGNVNSDSCTAWVLVARSINESVIPYRKRNESRSALCH